MLGNRVKSIYPGTHHQRHRVDRKRHKHVHRRNNAGPQNQRHEHEERDRRDCVEQPEAVHQGVRTTPVSFRAVFPRAAAARIPRHRNRQGGSHKYRNNTLIQVIEGQIKDALDVISQPVPVHRICQQQVHTIPAQRLMRRPRPILRFRVCGGSVRGEYTAPGASHRQAAGHPRTG